MVASLGPLVGTGESKKMTMLTSFGWWPVLIHALIDQGDLVTAYAATRSTSGCRV